MRGSLLAVVAIALITGLAVVAAVRYSGLLNPPPVVEVSPPPTPPAPAPPPPPPPRVLIPVRLVYVGDTIYPADVRARPIRPEEKEEFEKNKDAYLQPVPEVAYFRFPARDLLPDQPLRKTDLLEPKKPEALNIRLFPGTRAVGVAIPKERSVGGLIQVGDWVDVHLNTEISRTDNPTPIPYTGLLVPHALVVAKRDTLFSVYAGLPPGEPVPFTLATNPYRAALIEYGLTIGTLSLVPVAADEKKRLDKLKEEALTSQESNLAVTFAAPGSPDYAEETSRIKAYSEGSLAIGNDDLARVLRLKPIPLPEPPPPLPPPPAPPVTIELFHGVQRSRVATFPVATEPPPPRPYIPPPPAHYLFQIPGGPPQTPPLKVSPTGK